MPGLPGTVTGRGINAAGIVGFHNALDQGLRGDGLGKDGTALTTLFNAMPSGGGVIVLPPGTYNLDSSPSVPNNVTLMICAGVTFTGAGALSIAAGGALVDYRNGLTITGGLTLGTAVSQIVPGATSFSIRNNANNADNLLVTDAGLVTVRGDITGRRLKATGTSLVATDFVLSAGWGSTASVSVATGSTDARGQITITPNGAGIAVNPTVTLTYKDATWTTVPFAIVVRQGGSGTGTAADLATTSGATTLVWQLLATPVAGLTQVFNWMVVG